MPCLKLGAVFMYCYIALLEVMDYPGGMAQGPATKMNPLGLNQLFFLLYIYAHNVPKYRSLHCLNVT